MKTTSMLRFYAALMIVARLMACQNTDRNGNVQLDSAPVGNDSLRMADSTEAPNDEIHTKLILRLCVVFR